MKKVLVTGATGSLGMGAVTALSSKTNPQNIYALARSEEKAAPLRALGVNVRIGDYDDYASLLSAFKGIDTLYMISGTDISKRIGQHENMIEAASEAGVGRIVYTSYQRKTESPDSPISQIAAAHLTTEAKLKGSGIAYTILKHGTYAELIPAFAGQDVLTKQLISLPAGNGKTCFVFRKDLSEAAAIILLDQSGKYDNKSLEFSGLQAFSWDSLADMISAITHLPIRYVSSSEEEYKQAAVAAGMPAVYANLFAGFSKTVEAGECDRTSRMLEDVLGRKETAVESFLETIYGNPKTA